MKTDAFALRHIGPRENDIQQMLKTIGVESIDQLIYETLPDHIRTPSSGRSQSVEGDIPKQRGAQ